MKNKIWWTTINGCWVARSGDKKGGKAVAEILRPSIKDLAVNLLLLGGDSVIVPFYQHEVLCKQFELMTFNKVIWNSGANRNSFKNSYGLWESDPALYRLATGFALSEQYQSWHPQTWLCDTAGNIVETAVAATKYYGHVPDAEQLTYYKVLLG